MNKAIKQTKIASSSAKDHKKQTIEGEITNKQGKISSTNNLLCLDVPLI